MDPSQAGGAMSSTLSAGGSIASKRKGGSRPKRSKKKAKKETSGAGGSAAAAPSQPAPGRAADSGGATQKGEKFEFPGKYHLRLQNIRDDTGPDCLCKVSKIYTSPHLLGLMSDTRMSISGNKGYRLSRGTHAVGVGEWYYEVTVELNQGHVRVGWAQGQADMDLPCGCEMWSYSYRSREGTAFNCARPKKYGEAFETGDVIGCYISLPGQPSLETGVADTGGNGREGRTKQTANYSSPGAAAAAGNTTASGGPSEGDKQVVYWGQMAYYVIPHREPAQTPQHKGSKILFYKNGVSQGAAFSDVWQGEYYPAVSLFKNARVTYNFGPDFKYPPKVPARPVSELGMRDAAKARQDAWQMLLESNKRADQNVAAAAQAIVVKQETHAAAAAAAAALEPTPSPSAVVAPPQSFMPVAPPLAAEAPTVKEEEAKHEVAASSPPVPVSADRGDEPAAAVGSAIESDTAEHTMPQAPEPSGHTAIVGAPPSNDVAVPRGNASCPPAPSATVAAGAEKIATPAIDAPAPGATMDSAPAMQEPGVVLLARDLSLGTTSLEGPSTGLTAPMAMDEGA
jgi:hypothetical protein